MTEMTTLNSLHTAQSNAAAPWTAVYAGDSCLMLTFGDVLSAPVTRRVAACARRLQQAVEAGELSGVTDIVPAMVSLGIHYRPERVASGDGTGPFEALLGQIENILEGTAARDAFEPRRIEIPVCYGGDHGPDLDEVAGQLGVTPQALIELHGSEWIDVLMLGFAPGHPYIGVLPAQLNPPRRATPRKQVAAGSIGLANRQSVIYPLALPGGWNLIGRTPLNLFDVYRDEPCLLQAGDKVRFVPITRSAFDTISREGR